MCNTLFSIFNTLEQLTCQAFDSLIA